MRRIVCREFGPPEHLRLAVVPDPKPGPGEVLALLDADIPGACRTAPRMVVFPSVAVVRRRAVSAGPARRPLNNPVCDQGASS